MRLAGPLASAPAADPESETEGSALAPDERRLLAFLLEGRSNAEIATEVGQTPAAVSQALAAMYARIGAASRAEATVFALSGAV
jgi:DNA-binding NarL/FixJ family response regulator